MGQIWDALVGGLESTLRVYERLLEPLFSSRFAWGWAIILLTFTVRLFLLPLAVKQTRSMRAMQRLQPQIKAIQKKYKADRSMLRTDPERYKELRSKQQEATMKLYQEAKVNPAAGCLPLILQMPIFFALFSVLRGSGRVSELGEFGWYGIDRLTDAPTAAGFMGYVLIAAMIGTTYYQQRQMMAHTPGAEQNQQQKMLLYIMPVMLAFFSFNLPTGVLLYWVATNLWTVGQQYVMFRKVEHEVPASTSAGNGAARRPQSGAGAAPKKPGTRGSVSGAGDVEPSANGTRPGKKAASDGRDGAGKNGVPLDEARDARRSKRSRAKADEDS